MTYMETNRTNRTWVAVGPGHWRSNDGVDIVREEFDGEVLWRSDFLEEGIPSGWSPDLESAMLDADALEYDVDANGMWVVK